MCLRPSGYFLFFLLGGGEGGVQGARRGGGTVFFCLKSRGRQGFEERERGGSREGVCGDLKITTTSTEGQKRHENVAPVLVIIFGNSLVFSRKIITSTGFYRCCAPGASAPVVVKSPSPSVCGDFRGGGGGEYFFRGRNATKLGFFDLL